MAEQMAISSADIGGAINTSNQKVLQSLINLSNVSAGIITVNGTAGSYSLNQADIDKGLSINAATGSISSNGVEIAQATTRGGVTSIDVLAGGLVALQFKIDQIMASIQESIKNVGKVSQTREGAARA